MELASQDITLLHELAYLGVFRGHEYAAKDIFEFLQHIRPEADEPILGRALNLINNGSADEAIELLDAQLLSKKPAHIQGRFYKMMAHHKLGEMGIVKALIAELEKESALDPQTTLMLSLFKANELATA